jgi:predicted Zn-dependent peptidase
MNHPFLTVLAVSASLASPAWPAGDIPKRPEEIDFAPLAFEPPNAADYRHALSGGITAYLAPSSELPLVNVSCTFRGGSFLDPAEKIGLARATGAMMRRGGTADKTAEQLDEELDFLAANVSVAGGETTCAATLNCLAGNFRESFSLFMDILRRPRFQRDRLDLYKSEQMENLKQRNDRAESILRREWSALLYGRDHFEASQPTAAMIESITADDLKGMHARTYHPGNLVIAVSGDFEPGAMLEALNAALADWPAGEPVSDPPAPTATFKPGVYHVEKDIPQGKVEIGLRGIRRDDPDYFAMLVMEHILGGGGFVSRITKRVRSDEGLAYSAGSDLYAPVYYPGEINAGFQSKNRTVALATKLILEEFDRMRGEPVTEEELRVAQNSFIETFPRTFESKAGMLSVFVGDQITNRPAEYWRAYRDRVRAVTAVDVQRVAAKYLVPQNVAIMVVGKWDEIYAGDLEGRAKMSDFFSGDVEHLPLRDPLTLQPMN